jgi:hypothetical protein
MSDSSCWLGCVLYVDENTKKVKITFLHSHGPSPSFIVDPRTAMGCTYMLILRHSQTVISFDGKSPIKVAV